MNKFSIHSFIQLHISLQSFTLVFLQSFTISPAQIYCADLNSVVFFLLSFVVIYSLNKTYSLILVFSDPILFYLLLFLCTTFPAFYFLSFSSVCLCISSTFSFFTCLLLSFLLSSIFLLWFSLFIIYFLLLLVSFFVFYFPSWLSSTFFFCLSSIIFPLLFTLSFCMYVFYYYYPPILLFCIFYLSVFVCLFCLFFYVFLSLLFFLFCSSSHSL